MRRVAIALLFYVPTLAAANPPVASYIFPAGAQRGTKVNVRVGGLFLHQKCGFEMIGPGINAPASLTRTNTIWFEGPLLHLPDSQRQEDYPKDMTGTLAIDGYTMPGVRFWRLWTSQGATPSMKFIIGELPEIVEEELDGDPIPVKVTLPVTINGRIFPREDIDIYAFSAKKGQTVRCEVNATRLGSPLDARLEVRDAHGRRLAEADAPMGGDPIIHFTAPADGEYNVRIQDALNLGGQAYVYRLTLSSDAHVERVYPLGGRRDTTVDFEVMGQNVPARIKHKMGLEALQEFNEIFALPGDRRSNPVVIDVDDLPEFIHERDHAKTIEVPAILNGRITKPGMVNIWKLQGRKGDAWELELRAARLGSKLDGVITITDADGKTLAKAEASAAAAAAIAEASLSFKVPADGAYTIQVQDRYRARGGPNFAYRLRLAPPSAPNFRIWLASDAVTVPRKGTAKLKVNVDRIGGFKEPIRIEVQNLPKGVTVTGANINAGQTSVDLTFKADEDAKITAAKLIVLGFAKVNGQEAGQTAGLRAGAVPYAPMTALLAVAMPTPFVMKGEYDMGFAPRGGMHKRTYKIERNGYDGPIEVSLTDRQARHLQGVEGPTITVPAGASEFTYSAYLPPWMETGRTCRVCVMGVGVIKDKDGTEHRVTFSSVNQNEQLVAVIGPGKLAIEADRTSFTAEPGKSFKVPVRIKRGQGLEGIVELELIVPAHQRGITAAKATIAGKDENGELVVTCANPLTGPFTMPVIVRATLRQAGEPVVAELKLDVQP